MQIEQLVFLLRVEWKKSLRDGGGYRSRCGWLGITSQARTALLRLHLLEPEGMLRSTPVTQRGDASRTIVLESKMYQCGIERIRHQPSPAVNPSGVAARQRYSWSRWIQPRTLSSPRSFVL